MRRTLLSAVPMLALLAAAPAGAQISARIQIGRPPVRVYGPQIRPLVIYDYSPTYFGDWEYDYWDWMPVTLYLYEGRYYDRPYMNARPVVMYRYRDRYFSAPRDHRFEIWDRQYGRSSGRVFQNGRDFRDFRDHRGQYDPRNDNRGRQVNPRDDGRSRPGQVNPRDDGRGRPGQVNPRDDGRSQGGQQGGRGGQVAPRDDGRGRGGQAPPSSGRGGRGGGQQGSRSRGRP